MRTLQQKSEPGSADSVVKTKHGAEAITRTSHQRNVHPVVTHRAWLIEQFCRLISVVNDVNTDVTLVHLFQPIKASEMA